MYFAMDEIGFENTETIKTIASEIDRWRFIYNTTQIYGFDGIHITPSLYKKFRLDMDISQSIFPSSNSRFISAAYIMPFRKIFAIHLTEK
jgi:hypothetical protein